MTEDFKKLAQRARIAVLTMIHRAGTSHIGSNFSCIDLAAVLFSSVNLDGELKPERDRIIFSKGWAAATNYFFLAEKGIIPKEDLDTFCMPGSNYLGLVEPSIRGIDVAGGAMGHGLPIGVGMALAAKREGSPAHIYVLMSDGEMDCGTTWESALLAAHHKLTNLTVIVDQNDFQAMGTTSQVLNIEPLKAKWTAFGWNAKKIDGHDFRSIAVSLRAALKSDGPTAIIAKTTKGKGVSFMENKLEWHYKNVNAEDYQKAVIELNA